MKFNLRLLYLYLFSFVGLLIVVIGSVQLVNLAIKTFVFPEADKYSVSYPVKLEGEPEFDPEIMRRQQDEDVRRQKQRELANSIAMLAVGTPLYLYHWKTIQKEAKVGKKS